MSARVPQEQRPDVLRRILAIREEIGSNDAALVSTIDEFVRRSNPTSHTVG